MTMNQTNHQLDDHNWDKDRLWREFDAPLQSGNDTGLKACFNAMYRLNCWHETFAQLINNPSPRTDLGRDLLSLWNKFGTFVADGLKSDRIFVDALKYLVPAYSGPALTLYRGESGVRHRERIYGLSWSTERVRAEAFAHRHRPEEGVVLMIEEALPKIIVAKVVGYFFQCEGEYIVDPRLIESVALLATVNA
jgi:hypothetical protein